MHDDGAPENRSASERVLHATLYELIAVLICAPLLAWFMGTPLTHMGALTLAISATALAWNVVYNAGFDRLRRRWRFGMTPTNRLWHGVGFEGGLVFFTVPLAAWWLGIGLWQAFLLDAAILLFFLPYTIAYNWSYDLLRARWRLWALSYSTRLRMADGLPCTESASCAPRSTATPSPAHRKGDLT